MAIRSPKDGYDFEAKQKYREDVWGVFREQLDNDAKILFFPSKEGLEVPTALNLGFKQENLIAVDSSPAIIAHSGWRKAYPLIKFYGGMLSEVVSRIKSDNISISGANLDLCNNLSHELIDQVNCFAGSGILSDKCIIAITVMNGRESKALNTVADLFLNSCKSKKEISFENKRIAVVCETLSETLKGIDFKLSPVAESSYMSGRIRMSYAIVDASNIRLSKDHINNYYYDNIDWKYEVIKKWQDIPYEFKRSCPEKKYPGCYVLAKKNDCNTLIEYIRVLDACSEDIKSSMSDYEILKDESFHTFGRRFGKKCDNSIHMRILLDRGYTSCMKRLVSEAGWRLGSKKIKTIDNKIAGVGWYEYGINTLGMPKL